MTVNVNSVSHEFIWLWKLRCESVCMILQQPTVLTLYHLLHCLLKLNPTIILWFIRFYPNSWYIQYSYIYSKDSSISIFNWQMFCKSFPVPAFLKFWKVFLLGIWRGQRRPQCCQANLTKRNVSKESCCWFALILWPPARGRHQEQKKSFLLELFPYTADPTQPPYGFKIQKSEKSGGEFSWKIICLEWSNMTLHCMFTKKFRTIDPHPTTF